MTCGMGRLAPRARKKRTQRHAEPKSTSTPHTDARDEEAASEGGGTSSSTTGGGAGGAGSEVAKRATIAGSGAITTVAVKKRDMAVFDFVGSPDKAEPKRKPKTRTVKSKARSKRR
jgi:hypothetical protein